MDRLRIPHKLVSLRVTVTCATPFAVGVFTMRPNDQRLSVDHFDPTMTLQSQQNSFHGTHQPLYFGGPQAAAHRGLRWQPVIPQPFRPVVCLARPTGRPIMHDRPKVHGHDLGIEKSTPASKAEDCHTTLPCDIKPSRVRVPYLVSFEEGTKTSIYANSFYFLVPPCLQARC